MANQLPELILSYSAISLGNDLSCAVLNPGQMVLYSNIILQRYSFRLQSTFIYFLFFKLSLTLSTLPYSPSIFIYSPYSSSLENPALSPTA